VRILFVNLPSVPKGAQQIKSMPMGILYLSAYIKAYTDCEVKMLDIGEEPEDWIPDIIAYSVIFSSSHSHFVEKVAELKKVFPDALTIAGGNHATNAFEEIGRHVDNVFLGEAELTLTHCLKNGFPSKYIKSELMDITDMLQPDWDLIDMDKYINSDNRAMQTDKKTATIITSRGCPFKCTFCAAHTVHGRKLRLRSIDSVVEEVKELNERYGVTLFIIEDDLFCAPKSRGLGLLKRFRELKIDGFEMRFPSAFSVKILDEDIINALIESGTDIFNIAIESGHPRIQKEIKKEVPLDKAKKLVAYVRSKGKVARVYFMLGFPGETREDMQVTIDYAISLKADWCRFAAATPLIGSEMYQSFLPFLPNDIWEGTHFGRRCFDTPGVSGEELTALVREAHNYVNYLHGPYFGSGQIEKGIVGLRAYSGIHPDKKVQLLVSIENQNMTYKVWVEKGEE